MKTLQELFQDERGARDLWEKEFAKGPGGVARDLRCKILWNEWYDAHKAYDAALDAEAERIASEHTATGLAAE